MVGKHFAVAVSISTYVDFFTPKKYLVTLDIFRGG